MSVTDSTRCVLSSASIPTAIAASAGVCAIALLMRLRSTCMSRFTSPDTTGGSSIGSRCTPMSRSGAAARAECTASDASESRSTGRDCSGRCASSLASISKSSTSSFIRCASVSMRPIASEEGTAPCLYSSPKPLIEVSGVRSSWLASAMNRRIVSSDSRACRSEASVAANARWMCPSIVFSDADKLPTSVFVGTCGTRMVRLPSAMAWAVSSTRRRGRRLARTSR